MVGSTKVHLAADSRSRPLGFMTTLGQRHDSIAFELTLAQVAFARVGPGRPRKRPDAVLCDTAYSSRAIRHHLSRRRIKAVIAIKDDQHTARLRKGSKGGRPPSFDLDHYRDRNTVERAVNKLRAHRAVGTATTNATTSRPNPRPTRPRGRQTIRPARATPRPTWTLFRTSAHSPRTGTLNNPPWTAPPWHPRATAIVDAP